MTVLVEDDPSIRKLVEYALSSNSIPVVSFVSGEDAFSSLPDKVDLFLLDRQALNQMKKLKLNILGRKLLRQNIIKIL